MSIPIKIKRKADGSIDNITFCPSITIEKQVWESTLNRSMVLQAENTKLKELLEECYNLFAQEQYEGGELSTSELIKICTKIDEVLGEKEC